MDVYNVIKFIIFAGFVIYFLFAYLADQGSRRRFVEDFKKRPIFGVFALCCFLLVFAGTFYLTAYPDTLPDWVGNTIVVAGLVLLVGFIIWARRRGKKMEANFDRVVNRNSGFVDESKISTFAKKDVE